MSRLSSLERGRAIGQLQAGVNQNVIATSFGVSQPTIVRDMPRYGRPRVTSAATARLIEMLAAG